MRNRSSFACSLVLLFSALLNAPSTRACSCMELADGKTMRDLVISRISRKPSGSVLFEGTVMAQEVRNGEVEPPLTTLSMTAFGARRIVSFRVARSYRETSRKPSP